jgi:hypothetical protein
MLTPTSPSIARPQLLDLQLGSSSGSGNTVDIHNIVSQGSRGPSSNAAAAMAKTKSVVSSAAADARAAAAVEPPVRPQPAPVGDADLPDDLPPLE